MDIKLAKQVLTEALDRAFKAGLFNVVEAKNVTDALLVVTNMPEFEPQGEPQPISAEDLKKFNPEQAEKA
jgi:hypothetical protein